MITVKPNVKRALDIGFLFADCLVKLKYHDSEQKKGSTIHQKREYQNQENSKMFVLMGSVIIKEALNFTSLNSRGKLIVIILTYS